MFFPAPYRKKDNSAELSSKLCTFAENYATGVRGMTAVSVEARHSTRPHRSMISENIARQVLTIGPAYNPPKGGIAQTLYSYDTLIFGGKAPFLVNSRKGSKLGNGLLLLRSLLALCAKMVFCRSIKVVHVHTASKRSFPRSVLYTGVAHFFGRKTVMHVHGGGFRDYFQRHEAFVRKHLRRCDAVIALSTVWQDFFTNEVGHPRVYVVNNVVPEPAAVERDDNDGPVHALFLGLLTEGKGIFDLVETIGRHAGDYRGRLVLHVGGNGDQEQLNALIKQYAIADIVVFEGWVSGDRKDALLRLSSIYLLPSYVEGLPISILEAMSYGMAVVASDVGGIPSIVEQGRNGYLVKPGDKDALPADPPGRYLLPAFPQ